MQDRLHAGPEKRRTKSQGWKMKAKYWKVFTELYSVGIGPKFRTTENNVVANVL